MADELKRKRGYAKASLSRLEKAIVLINDTTTSIDISIQLEQLEKIYNTLINLDEEIVTMEKSDQGSEIPDLEARYFAAKLKLRTVLKKQSEREINDQMNLSIGQLSEQQKELIQSLHETSFIHKDEVKLQAVQIPTFSGNYADFPTFKDLFEVTIDKSNLSRIHKFKYLKGLLQGEAFNLIRHMNVTEANYEEAWNKIVQRYDVKDQICASLIKQFLDQSHATCCPKSVRVLADKTDEVLRGMKALGKEAELRDVWLVYLLLQKCDIETRRAWALENDETFPPIDTLLKFLVKRSNALERAEPLYTKRTLPKRQMTNLNIETRGQVPNKMSCPNCNNEHYLFNCEEFIKMPLSKRREFIASKGLCFICMKSSHSYKNCRSKHRCTTCKGQHNSLLHVQKGELHNETKNECAVSSNHNELTNANAQINAANYSAATLPTALVRIKDALGNYHFCKAMLDSGSQATFIDEKFASKLQLPKHSGRIAVSGLATRGLVTKGLVELEIYSRDNNEESINVKALILNRMSLITNPPKSRIDDSIDLSKIKLADPQFHSTSKISLLLGADVFFLILRKEQLISNTFVAQNTIFGYVIAGSSEINNLTETITLNLQLQMNIEDTLTKFWQTEETPLQPLEERDNHPAEVHFKNTFKRSSEGRFIVKLPFKDGEAQLTNSYYAALKRLESLQRKLNCNQSLKAEYTKFVEEYEALGHMKRMLSTEANIPEKCYYLPHHAVIRECSSTTKVRVVFDGSCRTTNGTSLNNLLIVGPTIQPTLWSILLQFRKHKYALTADIQKMYRQVWLNEGDRNYQRILWMKDQNTEVQTYQLLTVTYGTASAPFLATRCLKQLGLEEKDPTISHIIQNSFYVDDLLTGSDSIKGIINIKQSLSTTLSSGGFNLHKWASNITDEQRDRKGQSLQLPSDNDLVIKILGLQWIPSSDCFTFKVEPMKERTQTKRIMLSESSRLFDPLGWISPSIIICKTIFQQLWLRKISWDEELPSDLNNQWLNLRKELGIFEELRIPRFIHHMKDCEQTEYHGFADASQIAYAAVIYCRTQKSDKSFEVSLVTSKTRVAPIKTVTIPRLELCAAHLLCELLMKVAEEFSIPQSQLFVWTDSMVVLAWLSSHPSNWKQFVRNRTSNILDKLPRKHWNYVSTKCNPADLASRGVTPSRLVQETIWWQGPHWLSLNRIMWPSYKIVDNCDKQDVELKHVETLNLNIKPENCLFDHLFARTNDYPKMLRMLSYVLRFIRRAKLQQISRYKSVSAEELDKSEVLLVKYVQNSAYPEELVKLNQSMALHKTSNIRKLCPFIDNDGIMRVGGRLQNAELSFNERHPMILPKSHFLGKIIITYTHIANHHPGPSLTSFLLRQRFWIVNCRNNVKKIIKNCVICRRYSATIHQQKMAALPPARVSQARPFSNVGVDYAGPVMIATKRGRGAKLVKSYIAIFVCYCTKAIHLELVSDYTADAFIGSLKRFSARRGIPANIYCDNGTNFVGGDRKLRSMRKEAIRHYDEIKKTMMSEDFIEKTLQYWANNRTSFHFNPPLAPNHGGLYEAVVKMTKKHLTKSTGRMNLTFEETSTLLCEIEAILNSRPLCQAYTDDHTYFPLTPGHFLIGVPLTRFPEIGQDKVTDLGNQWIEIQRRVDVFWQRFQVEYLNTMQQRQKWISTSENVRVGEVVLLKDVNLPTTHWPIGIIEEVHPGEDNLVRVVTVRTHNSQYKRPISKIIRLPVQLCKE